MTNTMLHTSIMFQISVPAFFLTFHVQSNGLISTPKLTLEVSTFQVSNFKHFAAMQEAYSTAMMKLLASLCHERENVGLEQSLAQLL